MAETMRSVTALLALLADNTSGDISEQDLRDMLYSVGPRGAIMYISTPIATTLVQNVAKKAAGTTTLVVPTVDFTMPSSNRLTYGGAVPINFIALSTISLTSSGSNVNTTMSIAKNGVVEAHTEVERKIGSGSDTGAAPVICGGSLSNGDYLEAWIENNSGTDSITYERMNMIVMGWVV